MYRQSEKNLLSSRISSTCPHNMVNFGPLAAEIFSLVWGTPANFNGFRFLAALLHGTLVVGVSQTLRRWTEGTTYIRQGGHHVGHWPSFLVCSCVVCFCSVRFGFFSTKARDWLGRTSPKWPILYTTLFTISGGEQKQKEKKKRKSNSPQR